MSCISKSTKTESRSVVARSCGEGTWEVTANGYGISFYEMKMFWSQIVVMVVQLGEYTANH